MIGHKRTAYGRPARVGTAAVHLRICASRHACSATCVSARWPSPIPNSLESWKATFPHHLVGERCTTHLPLSTLASSLSALASIIVHVFSGWWPMCVCARTCSAKLRGSTCIRGEEEGEEPCRDENQSTKRRAKEEQSREESDNVREKDEKRREERNERNAQKRRWAH